MIRGHAGTADHHAQRTLLPGAIPALGTGLTRCVGTIGAVDVAGRSGTPRDQALNPPVAGTRTVPEPCHRQLPNLSDASEKE